MPRKPVLSIEQRRQRELAWLLYITEGYAANVRHALTVNAYTLDRTALRGMHQAIRGAESTAQNLRALLQG